MSALVNVSLSQALGIWADLVEAYHGVNGYGGNTAEIYMYRLMPRNPTAEHAAGEVGYKAVFEQGAAARAALVELIEMFSERYGAPDIWVDGLNADTWRSVSSEHHRAHVMIERKA